MHRTFNVSIPRAHIPDDEWIFEYGPAENDPEFGEGASSYPRKRQKMDLASMDIVDDGVSFGVINLEEQENSDEIIESAGRWVRRATGEKAGGIDGMINFTVVGSVHFACSGNIPFKGAHVALDAFQTE